MTDRAAYTLDEVAAELGADLDRCGQGHAALLAFGIGSALGLVAVTLRMLFVPYRVHRRA